MTNLTIKYHVRLNKAIREYLEGKIEQVNK